MIKKCPDCGSFNVEEVFDGEAYCKNCHLHCSVFDLECATVFEEAYATALGKLEEVSNSEDEVEDESR